MTNEYLSQIANQQVLLDPSAMPQAQQALARLSNSDDLTKISSEELASDDFWPAQGSFLSRLRPYVVRNGILEIPVKGVLLNDFPFAFGRMATGYTYIQKAFERGLDDSDVKGIALVIDSPGGAVAGNFDLVDVMYEARGTKPIRAYASELAASAAYSIASAADELTVARTGSVGSIGVVTTHMDMSKMLEDAGLKVTFIYAGKHKVDGNFTEPLPDDVKDRIQGRVDGLYEIFVSTVARNRGMSEQQVRDTEALTFSAPEALSNRLADSIGSLDDGLAEFSASLTQNQGGTTMSKEKENATVDQAQIDDARNEGHAEGVKEGKSAERSRFEGILALDETEGRRESAINIALTTDLTVEQAKSLLATIPLQEEGSAEEKPEGNSAFEKAMEQSGNPEIGASPNGGNEGDDEDENPVNAILTDYKAAGGAVRTKQ